MSFNIKYTPTVKRDDIMLDEDIKEGVLDFKIDIPEDFPISKFKLTVNNESLSE